MSILRNLYRRGTRTALTITGIAVGILALTVMGGMAEKINRIIKGGEAYFSHRIAVRPTGSTARLNLLLPADIAVLRQVQGVLEVETHVMLPVDDTAGFELAPRFLVGIDLPNFERAQALAGEGRLNLRKGTWWKPGDHHVAVIGSAIARKMRLNIGDTLNAQGDHFTVVGLLEETLSLPDGWAFVPESDARAIMLDESDLIRATDVSGFATNAYALIDPNHGDRLTDVMAQSLRSGFLLYSPQQLTKAAGQASTLLNTTILGSGVVAVIVGALSVVNTMFIAVSERTREIGIKKAIGASRWDIVREFLAESTFIGLVGGAVGVGLGTCVALAINWYTRDQGTPVFLMTPRLALGGLLFAALLGATAGVLPALRAASLDPVEALRQ